MKLLQELDVIRKKQDLFRKEYSKVENQSCSDITF